MEWNAVGSTGEGDVDALEAMKAGEDGRRGGWRDETVKEYFVQFGVCGQGANS